MVTNVPPVPTGRQQAVVRRLISRAERAEAAGQPGVARRYYLRALSMAQGHTRESLLERVKRLPGEE